MLSGGQERGHETEGEPEKKPGSSSQGNGNEMLSLSLSSRFWARCPFCYPSHGGQQSPGRGQLLRGGGEMVHTISKGRERHPVSETLLLKPKLMLCC
jgi:hypothetical protein